MKSHEEWKLKSVFREQWQIIVCTSRRHKQKFQPLVNGCQHVETIVRWLILRHKRGIFEHFRASTGQSEQCTEHLCPSTQCGSKYRISGAVIMKPVPAVIRTSHSETSPLTDDHKVNCFCLMLEEHSRFQVFTRDLSPSSPPTCLSVCT